MDLPRTEVRLVAPALPLASCVRAHILRNTAGAQPPLGPADRFNHFPASPLCALTWFVQGEAEWFKPSGGSEILARAVFSGPQTRPFSSYNPGPVQALMVFLFPDAMQALAGIDMADHVDRFRPIDEVLGAAGAALSAQVFAARDDDERVARVEAFLRSRWQAAQAGQVSGLRRLERWLGALAVRAATSGTGRSLRQAERRIKAWAGLPLRQLRRLDRGEALLLASRDEVLGHGAADWGGLAAELGYADQAHLCREVRALTGHSPQELQRRALQDEAYWLYRLWA